MTCSIFFYLTSFSEAIMPGESANSQPIIPSEDAATEGFNMGKYLVRRPRPEACHLKTYLNITVKIKIIILRFLCQPLFLNIQSISDEYLHPQAFSWTQSQNIGKNRRPWQPGATRFDVANSTSEAAATIADESTKYIRFNWEKPCLNSSSHFHSAHPTR